MFKSISWQTYLQFVAIATGIYYCAVILLIFRPEARSLVNRVLNPKRKAGSETASSNTVHTEVLQYKLDEIRAILSTAGYGVSKQALFAALQDSLAGYDGMYLSLHRDAIILFISTQSFKLCGLELSDLEIQNGIAALAQ